MRAIGAARPLPPIPITTRKSEIRRANGAERRTFMLFLLSGRDWRDAEADIAAPTSAKNAASPPSKLPMARHALDLRARHDNEIDAHKRHFQAGFPGVGRCWAISRAPTPRPADASRMLMLSARARFLDAAKYRPLAMMPLVLRGARRMP